MSAMFHGASNFNGSLLGWDTAFVISMAAMFQGKSKFNFEVFDQDTAIVTDMLTIIQDEHLNLMGIS